MRGGHVTRHVKTDMERVIMVAAKEGTNDAQVGPHCPLPGATGTNRRAACEPTPPGGHE